MANPLSPATVRHSTTNAAPPARQLEMHTRSHAEWDNGLHGRFCPRVSALARDPEPTVLTGTTRHRGYCSHPPRHRAFRRYAKGLSPACLSARPPKPTLTSKRGGKFLLLANGSTPNLPPATQL